METKKKAYIVWHEGMLNSNPHLGYTMDDIPVVYAPNQGQAKTRATEPYNYELDGDTPKYTDLQARRKKSADLFMFEEKEMTRGRIERIKKERARIQTRRNIVEKHPDGTFFYIQRGYVGNSMLFWGKGSNGYYSDIAKAQLYTKQEVLDKFVNGREDDVIWESSHILSNTRTHVDAQYVSRDYCA